MGSRRGAGVTMLWAVAGFGLATVVFAVVGIIAAWAKPLRRFGSLADARPLEDVPAA